MKGRSGKQPARKKDSAPADITGDITDHKRAEQELQIRNWAIESAVDAIAISDLEGRLDYVNPAFLKLWRYGSRAEVMGRSAVDFWQTADRAKQVIDELGVTGGWVGELEARASDGSPFPVKVSASLIKNVDGEPIRMMASFADITERKRTEESLRESEERFSKAFATSPYAFIIANMADGAIIEVNDAFTTISGFSREEALGGSTLGLKIWVDEGDRQRMVASLRDGRPVVGLETRLRGKSGHIKTVLLSAQVIRLGNRPCIVSMAEDITERKRAEDELRKTTERLDLATSAAHLGIWDWDIPNNELVWDDRMYELYGIKRGDFAGAYEAWLAGVHPDDRDASAEVSQQARRGEREYDTEFRVVWPDRTVRHLRAYGLVVRDANGMPLRMTGINYDITARKQSEEAIAAEKERLAVTLRSIGDAVIATDVHGNIVLMNKVAETLTGWPSGEAVGRPLSEVFDVVNELSREHMENPVEKVLSSDNIIELANHSLLVSRDGAERVIADSGAPIRDQKGAIIGVVLVFRDVTEKQRFMDAIQRTAKLDALGVLAGGIAHDFNNMLAGIFGFIDLARSVSREAQTRAYLEATLATMHRARALTQQLLTFAKGGSPIQKITSLSPLIQEAATFALSGSKSACRFLLAEDLWPCNIDKNQIAQVIDNIVINAQQAMPNGGDIEISAENVPQGGKGHSQLARGDYVRVSIKDSGIGIPKDILPRIFDPFYTTKTKGHGLGLSTCHSIITRHGGCIEVESEPANGSTFHVYLPASSDAVVANGISTTKHKGSGTIIVVDDEEVVRNAIQRMCEALGYTVVAMSDSKEAIEFYLSETRAKRRFAAMILDLTIRGGMGGMETVAEIRKLNKEIPIFVVSGYSENAVMKNPVEFGFNASISKPFTIAELSETLEKNMAP
jgi:PAS domain S-box-containing protein